MTGPDGPVPRVATLPGTAAATGPARTAPGAPLPSPALQALPPALPLALPASPALVCDAGVVVQANDAASALAGRTGAVALLGLRVADLLDDPAAGETVLRALDGAPVPVRVVSWGVPGTDLVVVFLVDAADLAATRGALRAEQDRLTEVERQAGIGSWEVDAVTGEGRWTPGYYRLLGIEPGSVVPGAAAVLDVVHPDDVGRVSAAWEALLAGGPPVDLEYRVVRADGVRLVRAGAEAVRDPSGRVVHYAGTVRDVTEQRRVERDLDDERRRLAEAQEIADVGSFEWDPETDRATWSATLRALLGGVPAGPSGPTHRDYLALVHPEDRGWVEELWRRLADDAEPVECEHRVVLADGRVRTVRARGVALPRVDGDGGRPGGLRLVGTLQDITELRAAETRGERAGRRFADLFGITPVGIGIFDDGDRLLDANPALCDLLGAPLERLRGTTVTELVHPDERDERERTLRARLAAGVQDYTVPQRMLQRADGEPVWCELHVTHSVQDDGRRFKLAVLTDITERRNAQEALKHQATHDELTGLPNRRAVKDLLTELLADPDGDVAVLLCDLDNFKRVNDSLGHDAGDELLAALAGRLRDGLPDGCTAGRLSGDAYVVVAADAAAHGGVPGLVRRVESLLGSAVPVRGQVVRVSASIGVSSPETAPGGADDLLRFADVAMFEAKQQGTGRVALASAALMASADRQVELEGQLREALHSDGLELHFQPVVAGDGTVLSAEALVRWDHPERGPLSPGVFLPVARQGGLLRELDRWVLRTALREAAQWPQRGGRAPAVAVNLAGLVPGDPDFVDTVATAVAESGVPEDRLVLELVETALVDLPGRVRAAMDELVRRGVRFAVDDFGTGYSSLARLKELPAQIVKVDRQFVAGVGVDASDFAVARAVVDMARAMGRSCVAEGVETATQFHVLRGLGVDAYQGWLFSRSVPAREFRALVALGPLHVPRAG